MYDATAWDEGTVRVDPGRVAWFGGMTASALVLGPLTFTPGAALLCAVGLAVTLCVGHSVGLHRGIIHRSYRAPRAVTCALAYVAVLVGLGGVQGLVRWHDVRDVQQNRPRCHDYFAHRQPAWRDWAWNLSGVFTFRQASPLPTGEDVQRDRFFTFLERTWRWQQLPWALLLWAWGGLPFVVWGVCVRVAVGTNGHWLVGRLSHRRGYQHLRVEGAGVQGWNGALLGPLSMGEGFHANHHAFPWSARLGLRWWELDPGWWVLWTLRTVGLVRDVRTARLSCVPRIAPGPHGLRLVRVVKAPGRPRRGLRRRIGRGPVAPDPAS